MNVLKNIFAAAVITLVDSTSAVAGQSAEFITVDNVITLDKKVSHVQKSLERDNYAVHSTVNNTIYYFITPTETVYQTADTIITLVGATDGIVVEYADLHVAIMYNSENGTYSAGDVTVNYKTVQ